MKFAQGKRGPNEVWAYQAEPRPSAIAGQNPAEPHRLRAVGIELSSCFCTKKQPGSRGAILVLCCLVVAVPVFARPSVRRWCFAKILERP